MVNVRLESLPRISSAGGESIIDGGAAGGFQSIHPFLGLFDLLHCLFHQGIAIAIDRCGEFITPKRSLGLRLLRQYFSARLA